MICNAQQTIRTECLLSGLKEDPYITAAGTQAVLATISHFDPTGISQVIQGIDSMFLHSAISKAIGKAVSSITGATKRAEKAADKSATKAWKEVISELSKALPHAETPMDYIVLQDAGFKMSHEIRRTENGKIAEWVHSNVEPSIKIYFNGSDRFYQLDREQLNILLDWLNKKKWGATNSGTINYWNNNSDDFKLAVRMRLGNDIKDDLKNKLQQTSIVAFPYWGIKPLNDGLSKTDNYKYFIVSHGGRYGRISNQSMENSEKLWNEKMANLTSSVSKSSSIGVGGSGKGGYKTKGSPVKPSQPQMVASQGQMSNAIIPLVVGGIVLVLLIR